MAGGRELKVTAEWVIRSEAAWTQARTAAVEFADARRALREAREGSS